MADCPIACRRRPAAPLLCVLSLLLGLGGRASAANAADTPGLAQQAAPPPAAPPQAPSTAPAPTLPALRPPAPDALPSAVPPADTGSVAAATPPTSGARTLSLAEAVRTAVARHPALRIAQTNEASAAAQADQAFALLLPSLTGSASYRRATQRGADTSGFVGPGQSLGGRDYFQFGVSVNQLIYDFDQTRGRYKAAEANAQALQHSVADQRLELTLGVKSAYFQARAQLALVRVSQDTLNNQARHVAQVEGFVEVGTHPPIDLVQARADEQSDRLALVNAENAYALAKAVLAEAMGLQETAGFEVGDESEAAVPGEDGSTTDLFGEALQARPDVQAALRIVDSRQLSVAAARGGYGPSLGANAGVTESGGALDALVFNWSAAATLTVPFFEGGATRASVDQAQAGLQGSQAQLELLRQQILLAIERARLGVAGAKQALATSAEVVSLNRERLVLAEGRYQTGIGTLLELSDAQVALTTALAQNVQAEYNLSIARAQLVRALGR
jgi:outer membrane protein